MEDSQRYALACYYSELNLTEGDKRITYWTWWMCGTISYFWFANLVIFWIVESLLCLECLWMVYLNFCGENLKKGCQCRALSNVFCDSTYSYWWQNPKILINHTRPKVLRRIPCLSKSSQFVYYDCCGSSLKSVISLYSILVSSKHQLQLASSTSKTCWTRQQST